jgi:hypothetical protein
MTDMIATREDDLFELDQRRAKAYAQSGYWPDAADVAKALVKIEAGRALGLTPIVAMSEVHVIEGKPTLGAGALSSLVKASGLYDYRVVQLTDDACTLRFYERGQVIGETSFTMADAEKAGLAKRNPSYARFPRNMLFARAMSNGVAWFCPDVTSGRLYVPEDFADIEETDMTAEPVDEGIEWPDPDEEAETLAELAQMEEAEEDEQPEAV